MDKLLVCRIDEILEDNFYSGRKPASINELEKRAGLSPQGLLNLRSGIAEPKLSTAYHIAWALRTNIKNIWPPEQFDDSTRR